MLKVADYIKKYNELINERNDYIDAIYKLCSLNKKTVGDSNKWEEDIQKDNRASVRLLYSNFVRVRKEIISFENLSLTSDKDISDFDSALQGVEKLGGAIRSDRYDVEAAMKRDFYKEGQ